MEVVLDFTFGNRRYALGVKFYERRDKLKRPIILSGVLSRLPLHGMSSGRLRVSFLSSC